MTPLHTDTNLVSRIHLAQFEYLRGRMNAMRDVRGDPDATRYFEAEHLRACIAPGTPNPYFNQVFLSGPARLQDVESVLALFEQYEMTPQFELGPGAISNELALRLAGRGFIHTQSYPMLVQRERQASPHVSTVEVARVGSIEALQAFKDAYVRAWQVEEWLAPILRSSMERWLYTPGWALYVASQKAVPVGIGVSFESGGVAYLADAATIPEFRARGVQRCLIVRRLADAQQAGARLVFSRAEFGSTSQRNLERAGLECCYAVAIWTKAPPQPA